MVSPLPKDTDVVLCVAELDTDNVDAKTVWHPIGEQAAKRNGTLFFCPISRPVSGKMPVYPCDKSVKPFDVAAVKVYKDSPTTVRATVDESVKVYELVSTREFNQIYIEDQDKVREVLRSGFSLHFILRTAFADGCTRLIVRVPSKTGKAVGLMFDDKRKLQISHDTDCFDHCQIQDTPEDSSRAIHGIKIVNLGEIPSTLRYTFSKGKGDERVFLAEEPAVIGTLVPYDVIDYIPLFLKRHLDRAKGTLDLNGNDSKLVAKDIPMIIASAKLALEDETYIGDLLKIDNKEALKITIDSLANKLPELERSILNSTSMLEDLLSILMKRASFKDEYIKCAKKMWMEEQDKEREATEQAMAISKKTAEKAREELENLETKKRAATASCKEAEEKTAEAIKRENEANAKIAETDELLVNKLRKYKEDVVALATETGLIVPPNCDAPSEADPDFFTQAGFKPSWLKTATTLVPSRTTKDNWATAVMASNLQMCFKNQSAGIIAAAIASAIDKRMHLYAAGSIAPTIANLLSITIERSFSSSIYIGKPDLSKTIKYINEQPTRVVLVEGALAQQSDSFCISLARHCKEKILVFSMDDSTSASQLSDYLSNYITHINVGKGEYTYPSSLSRATMFKSAEFPVTIVEPDFFPTLMPHDIDNA